MRYLLGIAIILTATVCRAETPLSWASDEGSLSLLHGQDIVWRFNFGSQLSKPYFHPLKLPGGKSLTWESPPDHPWHYGLWFSWKYINGVNYWEENHQTHLSDGLTTWGDVTVKQNPDFSARFELDLKYHLADQPPVLSEHRVIDVSVPDSDGQYTIDWASTFTAQAEQVTLDRTPLPNEPGGQPSGGYAGLSVRLAKAASQFKVTASEQAVNEQSSKDQPERMRFRAHAADYSGSLDGKEGGITIIDDPQNANAPTPWYVIRNTKAPMTFFSPTVIQLAPMTLAPGDSFRLHYQIKVHIGPSPLLPSSTDPLTGTLTDTLHDRSQPE